MKFFYNIVFAAVIISMVAFSVASGTAHAQEDAGKTDIFILLATGNTDDSKKSLDHIKNNWNEGFVPKVLEMMNFIRDRNITRELISLMEAKTGQNHGYDINAWYEWVWNRDTKTDDSYAEFKSQLYGFIDPIFAQYFRKGKSSKIRLDEVRWGGVRQDGIPPLRNPKMIKANEASYLEGSNVVFGLEINGDARAYPKRILAWHEMFADEVGGEPVAGVYCTLCGTMVLYKTTHNGVNHYLGTSGFLYRSNKLMYDRATQSLWNTIKGEPVIGELAEKNIVLERLSVVTTTWAEWKERHPDTKVLSINTGHSRNYDEGEAYKSYFATDQLMFNVPKLDDRLKNKDEVLGLIFPEHPDLPLAISVKFLAKEKLYHDKIGTLDFVIITDNSGAARVYESKGLKFKRWDKRNEVIDENNVTWTMTEAKLESADGKTLLRLPAHRSFWFAWYSQYSQTRLIK